MVVIPPPIIDGVIVRVVGAIGGKLVRPPMSRRSAKEMGIAGWFDTEALIREGLPGGSLELAGLSEEDATELEAALLSDEVQGALQALLAARLTDAPETDATMAREAVRRALGVGGAGARYAGPLSEYFDDKICALVGHLEGAVGLAGLSQIRGEAYSSRMVALLGAIERQVAALSDPDRGGPEEAEFLDRYRRQAREKHGKLEPPDFERRRRISAEKIYVNALVHEHRDQDLDVGPEAPSAPGLNVTGLAALLDRTVLLGDPGGGKTTAANVLANFFASDPAQKVPFLVTLRDYAAKHPPERSVAGYIEQVLETLYQCRAPDRLVERLLSTGRAVVIFDGLDELPDPSRRGDVSDRVEQFCFAYPLTPVLVTSRRVGYDQARLDEAQFACYRLGGFGDGEVSEYAHKWFAIQEGASTAEAEADAQAFLAESASAPDLRSNPLLLSLMCILYRGAGSLPRGRASLYARCAELLFDKWDERRKIQRELRAGHLVEPAIRYLAWWLFNDDDPTAAVTERRLEAETTRFLHGRGFESEDEALAAAREFVEFCSGRMWVLSEAGTTEDGEKLYAFTHRTFLEYFAAAYLAAASDSPEDLARALAPHVAFGKWDAIGELSIQIKDRNSDSGADRVYAVLLDPAVVSGDRGPLLRFLAKCLESTQPSPATVRSLTRAALDYTFAGGMTRDTFGPLRELIFRGVHRKDLVADETGMRIAVMAASEDTASRQDSLRLALEVRWAGGPGSFWWRWSKEQARSYAADITAGAVVDHALRNAALKAEVISIEQALSMPGGFGALMGTESQGITAISAMPYPLLLFMWLTSDADKTGAITQFTTIGRYLLSKPTPPWVVATGYRADFGPPFLRPERTSVLSGLPLDEISYLGLAAVICVNHELTTGGQSASLRTFTRLMLWLKSRLKSGVFLVDQYVTRRDLRFGAKRPDLPDLPDLPELPVPTQFRQLFRNWAEGKAHFVAVLELQP